MPTIQSVGAILVEAVIALMRALESDHYHGFLPAVEELLEAPGLAVSGVRIQEQVVAVEEVHNGVALVCFIVVVRQIDVHSAVFPGGIVVKRFFDDHCFVVLSVKMYNVITGLPCGHNSYSNT